MSRHTADVSTCFVKNRLLSARYVSDCFLLTSICVQCFLKKEFQIPSCTVDFKKNITQVIQSDLLIPDRWRSRFAIKRVTSRTLKDSKIIFLAPTFQLAVGCESLILNQQKFTQGGKTPGPGEVFRLVVSSSGS